MTMIEMLLDGFGKAAAPATALAGMFAMRRRKRHALPAWAGQSAGKKVRLDR